MTDAAFMLADTATKFTDNDRGRVVVCGSHGGVYPGYCATKARLRAIVLNDAGVGKDQAGIGSLAYCAGIGMAAATVGHMTARIGDARDMVTRGRISHANGVAQACGVVPGMTVAEATDLLTQAPLPTAQGAAYAEGRQVVMDVPGKPRVVCIDSAAMVMPDDTGDIIVTGSHGGLVGGKPEMALRVAGLAGFFNDAGIGIDDAAIGRLPALDQRGIAAGTVSADSARIGDALSTLNDGILSVVNDTAKARGAKEGMPLAAFVAMLRG